MIKIANLFFLVSFFLVKLTFANSEEIEGIKINFSLKEYVKLKTQHEEILKKKFIKYKPKKYKIIISTNIDQKIGHKKITNYEGQVYLDGFGREHFWFKDVIQATLKFEMKDSGLFKFKEFKLLDPRPAYYDVPFFYNLLLGHFKLPSRKISMIKIRSNFSDKIYLKVLEESFGKNFIDSNLLPGGLIFKISIHNKKGHKAFIDHKNQIISDKEYINILNQNVNSKNFSKYDDGNDDELENLQKQFAFHLFQKYLDKNKKASEVFDLDTAVKYFLIKTIWGEMHSLFSHNIRFYFNPINKKIFLVPSDPFYPQSLKKINKNKIALPFKVNSNQKFITIDDPDSSLFYNRDWAKNLTEDNNFRLLYFKALLNIDELNLSSLIDKIDNYNPKFQNKLSKKAKETIKGNINHITHLMNLEKNKKLIKSNIEFIERKTIQN